MRNAKICFVALGAYSLLSKSEMQLVGGAELQQVLIAKSLLHKGYEVSFTVYDHGQDQFEVIDGIKILKSCKPKMNFFRKPFFIIKTLFRLNADVYFVRGASRLTLLVALFCFLKKKNLVYSTASIMDIELKYIRKKFIFIFIYKSFLKKLNRVIVQTKQQQELLKRYYDKASIVVKSGVIIHNKKPKKLKPPVVLWVGTIKKLWKQPELFIKLAESIPNAKFIMIGGSSVEDRLYYEKVKEYSRSISNLEFLGFIPYHHIEKYFEFSSIFVDTSAVAGFPNTFLQAWANYTPVVSIGLDPDNLISKHELGFCSQNFDQMVKHVNILLTNNDLREKMGINCKKYVEKKHDIKKIINEYDKILEELIKRGR